MIQVTLGTNTRRETVVVDENVSIKNALNENNVDYSNAAVHLDGSALQPGEINKTFAEMGITDKCYLIAVVKADNA